MGTMARAELRILIPLLLIFRFGDVLKCMDAAVFMVKTCFIQHLHSKHCFVLSSNTRGVSLGVEIQNYARIETDSMLNVQ